jgi:competence protein ComEC
MLRRLLFSVGLGSLLALIPLGSVAQSNEPLRFTFFALDRGEATLVETPEHARMLIGAGAPGEGPEVIRQLRKHGVKDLDTLLITTWSDAQLGGALDLLKAYPVRQLFHNSLFVSSKSADALWRYGQAREKARKLLMGSPGPGQSITVSYAPPCLLTVVAPTGPMLERFRSDRNCSMMVEYHYDKLSTLALGDSTRKHQQAMWDTARARPDGQVLVIGRGGSADALLPSLLKPLKTRIAVIPVARKSSRKPASATLAALRKAGVKTYRTDLQGEVTVLIDGNTARVRTQR